MFFVFAFVLQPALEICRRRKGQRRGIRDALVSNCLLIERRAMREIALLNYIWQRWQATSKTSWYGRKKGKKEGRKLGEVLGKKEGWWKEGRKKEGRKKVGSVIGSLCTQSLSLPIVCACVCIFVCVCVCVSGRMRVEGEEGAASLTQKERNRKKTELHILDFG